MANSPLVNYTLISPSKNSPRKYPITKITIHHMAGNLSIENCGKLFQTKKASSNYGIGTDGRVGMYVEEKDRSWCSSNADNDHRAVTIEVANDGGASTNWHVSDKALAKCIDLCVDICKRNGIKKLNFTGDKTGNLTMHKYFAATACPGPYLESKFPYIAAEVNKRLGAQPLSNDPVRMQMGFASAGDMKQIEAMLNEKAIPYHAADGYAITDVAVSKGDQLGLVQLCDGMGVPCVVYKEEDTADELKQQIADLEAEVAKLKGTIDEIAKIAKY